MYPAQVFDLFFLTSQLGCNLDYHPELKVVPVSLNGIQIIAVRAMLLPRLELCKPTGHSICY